MEFRIDSELTALALIHSIISDGEDIANKIEAVIATDPDAVAYGFPKENVHKIINALKMNATLSKNLLEQHQKIQDAIQESLKNANKPKE